MSVCEASVACCLHLLVAVDFILATELPSNWPKLSSKLKVSVHTHLSPVGGLTTLKEAKAALGGAGGPAVDDKGSDPTAALCLGLRTYC